MDHVITAFELLRIAEDKLGSLSAVARKSRICRSTLKRIKNGSTNAPHAGTYGKLAKAIIDE